ncbi:MULTISPECIES: ROK family protein [Subtercola]|uniref:ROK family protein n=1 Tax=Subtercola TaxID=120212 RepID=UPI001375A3A8|nr:MULTISPECIES: ROK family protein [Subtercola]MEA9986783.1 ROK family protein [Subtercola sp. RTI3]
MSDVTVGIDIGGTATRIVVVRGTQIVASTIVSTPTVRNDALPTLLSSIRAVMASAPGAEGEMSRVGIGASGPILAGGVIDNPESLPALSGWNFVDRLGELLGVDCRIDNDAVTAALAEVTVGAGRLDTGVLVMTLGTGVGVALMRSGIPFRGADGVHPEAGHITVDAPSSPCYCGRRHCLEQTASRTALQRLATHAGFPADLEVLAHAASEGDPGAQRVFLEYGTRIGEGLGELCTQHRPTIVVLGGSAATYLPHFRSGVEGALAALTSAPVPALRQTALGDLGGALGAALLWQ